MAKVSELETLALILTLPDDAALTTAEAAVVIRTSPRNLERWRATGEGPAYIQGGGLGATGSNQRITYFKRDLRAWQEKHKISSTVEAAVRRGQLFTTLVDVVEEQPFWRTPKGWIGGPVEDTSVELFLARLGRWEIEWLPAIRAAANIWESLLSQRAFAAAVSDVLRNQLEKLEVGLERSELEHSLDDAHERASDSSSR